MDSPLQQSTRSTALPFRAPRSQRPVVSSDIAAALPEAYPPHRCYCADRNTPAAASHSRRYRAGASPVHSPGSPHPCAHAQHQRHAHARSAPPLFHRTRQTCQPCCHHFSFHHFFFLSVRLFCRSTIYTTGKKKMLQQF